MPNTDSSVAATTSRATSTSAAVGAPAIHATRAAVEKVAPMAWAKRLGGPGTGRGGSRGRDAGGELTEWAQARTGEDAGPEAVGERDQQPVVTGGELDRGQGHDAAGNRPAPPFR